MQLVVLLGPRGGMNWNMTQTFFRANWDVIVGWMGKPLTPHNAFDSGEQPWPTFRCAGGCKRVLPADTAHVDHIFAQSHFPRYSVVTDTLPNGPLDISGGTGIRLQHEGPIAVVFTDEGQLRACTYKVDDAANSVTATGATKRKGSVLSGSGSPPRKGSMLMIGSPSSSASSSSAASSSALPTTGPSLFSRSLSSPSSSAPSASSLSLSDEPPPRHDFETTMTIKVTQGIHARAEGMQKDITEILANNMTNLQLLCNYCNVSKGNRDAWAWGAA